MYKCPKIKMSHNECKGKKRLLKDVVDSKHKKEKIRFQLDAQEHCHLFEGNRVT